jgi:hypothetical protein
MALITPVMLDPQPQTMVIDSLVQQNESHTALHLEQPSALNHHPQETPVSAHLSIQETNLAENLTQNSVPKL